MYFMLVINQEHPVLKQVDEQGVLKPEGLSGLVLGVIQHNFPELVGHETEVSFNYVVNRVIGNHAVFFVQLPNVDFDALVFTTAFGEVSEANDQSFLDDLLNGQNISTLVVNPAVGLIYKYHHEIMQNVGAAINDNIRASLLREPGNNANDLFTMIYPGVSGSIYDQFTNQEKLVNWTVAANCKVAEPVAVNEPAQPKLTTEDLAALPEDFAKPRVLLYVNACDYNPSHGFDGFPFDIHRVVDGVPVRVGDEDFNAVSGTVRQDVLIATEFLKNIHLHCGSADYAEWSMTAESEIFGPGSYIAICEDGDKFKATAVKHDADNRVYKQLPEIITLSVDFDSSEDPAIMEA